GGEGASRAAARREAGGQRDEAVPRSPRPPGRAHPRGAGPLGGEKKCPNGSGNGSGEKIAGTRSDPGDYKRLELRDFQRAGDGTRTHDVQLGKLAFYQLNYAREVYVR